MAGLTFSGLLLLSATLTPCQSAFASEQMAGAKLKHFAEVDKNVYKGSKPISDADFRFLQSLHVKYIVDLEIFPFMTGLEQRKAKRYGITVIRGLMNASPVSPSKKISISSQRARINRLFPLPTGRDRTNVIAALYKMYFLDDWAGGHAICHEEYKDGWCAGLPARYIRSIWQAGQVGAAP